MASFSFRQLLFSMIFAVFVQKFDAILKLFNVNPQPENHAALLINNAVFHDPEKFRANYEEMERDFKIYVYPEGRPPSSILSPQYLFHDSGQRELVYPFLLKNILESPFSTTDPNQAHLFFLPFPRDRQFPRSIAHDGRIIPLWDYVERIISKYPYWHRTQGTDHFFVNCNDFKMYGVRDLTKNAIHVICPIDDHFDNLEFVPRKNVSLATVRLRHAKSAISDTITRVFSAGSARDFRIFDHLSDEPKRLSEFTKERFCFCYLAIDVFDSIANGCVPVLLFSEYHELPFSDILDWRKFSVIMKEVGLKHYNNIDDPEYKQLQENLFKVRQHFVWNSPPVKYDAFHMVMYQLWSHRHSTKN